MSQRLSKPFWPPALASQAPPAILLAALRRFRGPALFRGLRPCSSPGAPFWPSGLTLRSSRPAYGGRLTLAVSPFIFRFYAGQHLFQRLAFLRAFSFGFLALCWASPACTAQVSCLFGLQRLHSKRHQLSFFKQCVASVAHCFFEVCARRQFGASRFGLHHIVQPRQIHTQHLLVQIQNRGFRLILG